MDSGLLAILGVAGAVLFLLVRYHPVFDDAYITFRYAANLARGFHFTFNPGDPPVQGTTTPLFTFVLAGASRIGMPIPESAAVIGAICHALTILVLGRLTMLLIDKRAAFFVAALYSISFPAMNISGMETPRYTLLIVLCFYLMVTTSWNWAFFAAGLATLVRIDGALVMMVLAGYYFIKYKRFPVWPMLIFALTIVPWFVFAYNTFGHVLPNSFLAKLAFDPYVSGRFTILGYFGLFGYFFGLDPFVFIAPFVVLGAIGAWRIELARPLLAWLIAYLVAYSFAQLPFQVWYYTPTLPFVYLVLLCWRPGCHRCPENCLQERSDAGASTFCCLGACPVVRRKSFAGRSTKRSAGSFWFKSSYRGYSLQGRCVVGAKCAAR